MNENTKAQILEHLEAIRAIQARMEEDAREDKLRRSSAWHGQVGRCANCARLQSSIDRLSERVHRIEKRLGLVD